MDKSTITVVNDNRIFISVLFYVSSCEGDTKITHFPSGRYQLKMKHSSSILVDWVLIIVDAQYIYIVFFVFLFFISDAGGVWRGGLPA